MPNEQKNLGSNNANLVLLYDARAQHLLVFDDKTQTIKKRYVGDDKCLAKPIIEAAQKLVKSEGADFKYCEVTPPGYFKDSANIVSNGIGLTFGMPVTLASLAADALAALSGIANLVINVFAIGPSLSELRRAKKSRHVLEELEGLPLFVVNESSTLADKVDHTATRSNNHLLINRKPLGQIKVKTVPSPWAQAEGPFRKIFLSDSVETFNVLLQRQNQKLMRQTHAGFQHLKMLIDKNGDINHPSVQKAQQKLAPIIAIRLQKIIELYEDHTDKVLQKFETKKHASDKKNKPLFGTELNGAEFRKEKWLKKAQQELAGILAWVEICKQSEQKSSPNLVHYQAQEAQVRALQAKINQQLPPPSVSNEGNPESTLNKPPSLYPEQAAFPTLPNKQPVHAKHNTVRYDAHSKRLFIPLKDGTYENIKRRKIKPVMKSAEQLVNSGGREFQYCRVAPPEYFQHTANIVSNITTTIIGAPSSLAAIASGGTLTPLVGGVALVNNLFFIIPSLVDIKRAHKMRKLLHQLDGLPIEAGSQHGNLAQNAHPRDTDPYAPAYNTGFDNLWNTEQALGRIEVLPVPSPWAKLENAARKIFVRNSRVETFNVRRQQLNENLSEIIAKGMRELNKLKQKGAAPEKIQKAEQRLLAKILNDTEQILALYREKAKEVLEKIDSRADTKQPDTLVDSQWPKEKWLRAARDNLEGVRFWLEACEKSVLEQSKQPTQLAKPSQPDQLLHLKQKIEQQKNKTNYLLGGIKRIQKDIASQREFSIEQTSRPQKLLEGQTKAPSTVVPTPYHGRSVPLHQFNPSHTHIAVK